MKRLRLAFATLTGALAAAGAAQACSLPGEGAARRAESTSWIVLWRPAPDAVKVGAPFSLDIAVCPRSGAVAAAALKVDAHMPAHRHGMNYKTTVVAAGEGRFRADGLVFHMPGRWQVLFDIGSGPGTERAAADWTLP